MRIEFSAELRGARHDLALEAPDSATLGAVAPALRAAVGAAPQAQLWLAGRPLGEDVRLADAGLHAGSVIGIDGPAGERVRPTVLALHVVSGPDAGRIVELDRGRLHIGRDPLCEVALPDADVSRRHALVEVGARAITLRDLGSTNGTRVDGRTVPSEGCSLTPGSLIAMGDSQLTVAGPVDAPATVQSAPDGMRAVVRSPRRRVIIADREIELPTSPSQARPRGVQWVTALLPALAGGAIAWIAHSPQFLLFALLSPVMMVSTALGDRLHWRRSRRRNAATFAHRRAEAQRQVADALEAESANRRAAAPDAATVLLAVSVPTSRVWERRREDRDLLHVRLGVADLPSTLRMRAGPVAEAAGTLEAVPVSVDLRRGPLGVSGPADVVAASLRWLIGQVAALHSPVDVELGLLLDRERAGEWSWARWLPQVRGRVATAPDEWSALVADAGALVEQRLRGHGIDRGGWSGPWFLLVIDRVSRLSEVPGLPELLRRGPACGVTAICADTEPTALPTACAAVVRVSGDTGSRFRLHDLAGPDVGGVLDGVSCAWSDEAARRLAPLVDVGVSDAAALPDTCRLVDVLELEEADPSALDRRWAASTGGASTALGRSPDGPLQVDLVRDGPHALIAGTTGSGKSELLQALVAGLAANHPPTEINFLLIDYKGGAAFADCARLPHTAGLVTDLDPYLTERALRSLNSELRRRERLFADAGVADLAGYRAAPAAEPIPRLVIVVDEFASLADELPEFVRGLVAVAQRGRSLGVHLVLATQRPGRAVSPEIRANTSLRIALRVTDPAESSDVIDTPDAALIDRSVPGRGYVRTGSTLTCFQAAQVGSVHRMDDEVVRIERLGPWRRATTSPAAMGDDATDLARLVDGVRAAARRAGYPTARSTWLAPLPDALPRAGLDTPADPAAVGFARVDLPDDQRCATLSFDLAAGSSLLAAGASRSGRTGLLASLAIGAAERLDPSQLNLHVIDAGGDLADALGPLPHAATLLGPHDVALAPRLLHRLEQACSRRIGGVPDLAVGADRPCRLLLLIDGWDALTAALGDADALACTEALAGLLRAGPAAGVSVAVTGGRSTLAPRFSGGFGGRILFRLPDRGDYGLGGIAMRDVPAALPPGRGLRTDDGAVLQVAHAGDAPGIDALRRAVAAVVAHWSAAPRRTVGPDAIRVRPLPVRVSLRDLPHIGPFAIGLAGDQSQPLAFDPFSGAGRVLVAGPPRSGRTTLLRSLAAQAAAAGVPTVVAAPSRSALAGAARSLSLPVFGPADDVGPIPGRRTLLLVDDSEAFLDCPAGDRLTSWLRSTDAAVAAVVAGRSDDLATTYRGVAADVRRSHCGILLRPGPVDGELLGTRLPRRPSAGPPGRGIAVGEPSWGPLFDDGEPVPVQVAEP